MAAENGRLRHASRVLIATDSCGDVGIAVEAGVSLAAATGTSLEGVFVEDSNLFRLAALPFVVETSTLTGARRALVSDEMERALRVEAARLQSLIAGSAARAQLAWSFHVLRGELLIAADAQRADLTIVALGKRRLSSRAGARRVQPIAALFDASVAGWRSLDAASRVARALGSGILVLAAPPGAEASRQHSETAAAWLRREGIASDVVPVTRDSRALSAVLRAHPAALLVLPASDVTPQAPELRQLMLELPCPLMIVR
jgi:hypothetical protein